MDVNEALAGGKFKLGSAGDVEYGTDTLRRMIGEANGLDPDDIKLVEWKVPQARTTLNELNLLSLKAQRFGHG